MSQDEELKQAYNTISGVFRKTRTIVWDDLVPLQQYAKEGDHILDLGCGSGRLYQLFAEKSISYVGADFSEGQIVEAQKHYPDAEFVVAEMVDLPFEDKSFDTIYCIAAFHHLSTASARTKSLSEMHRVLKSGGTLVLTNWNLDCEWAREKVAVGKWKKVGENGYLVPWRRADGSIVANRYYYGFDKEKIQKLLEESNFVAQEIYTTENVWTDDKRGGNLIAIATAQ